MVSAQKMKANHINAQASTGPKSIRGKARSAQNARRHGLSLSIFTDPMLSVEVQNVARKIAGDGASVEILSVARRVAEAQLDLARVRKTKYDHFARVLGNPHYIPHLSLYKLARGLSRFLTLELLEGERKKIPPKLCDEIENFGNTVLRKQSDPERLAHMVADTSRKLVSIDRYERRALSRRKFAIRELDDLLKK